MSLAIMILPIVLEYIGPIKYDTNHIHKEGKMPNETKNKPYIEMGEYVSRKHFLKTCKHKIVFLYQFFFGTLL